jgi:hypothetical protein
MCSKFYLDVKIYFIFHYAFVTNTLIKTSAEKIITNK